jgi:hypothetical protein
MNKSLILIAFVLGLAVGVVSSKGYYWQIGYKSAAGVIRANLEAKGLISPLPAEVNFLTGKVVETKTSQQNGEDYIIVDAYPVSDPLLGEATVLDRVKIILDKNTILAAREYLPLGDANSAGFSEKTITSSEIKTDDMITAFANSNVVGQSKILANKVVRQ